MTIPSSEVKKLLINSPDRRVEVRYLSGDLAFTCTGREAYALARERAVEGIINRHGYLRYVTLTVPLTVARRIQRGSQLPELSRHVISHRVQAKGARKWVWRPDQAKNGQAGAYHRLFDPASKHCIPAN